MAQWHITAVHVEYPGTHEQHITEVKLASGKKETREQVYDFIKGGQEYFYTTGIKTARVLAEKTSAGTKFIRTHPDDVLANNLLSLPRF